VLDTLGKLYAHGHGLGGYCLVCQRVFDVSLPVLILERGPRPLQHPHGAAAARPLPGVAPASR
jgi:hypothetical protein